jgi:hypothetical protein
MLDLNSVLNLLSAIAALSAVIIAILSQQRANKQFRQNIELQNRIAAANIRPLLTPHYESGLDLIEAALVNAGLGTAVIKQLTFSKGDRKGPSIPSVVDLPVELDCYDTLDEPEEYLQSGQDDKMVILSLSRDVLKEQGFRGAEIRKTFRLIEEQIDGVILDVDYEDALGNKQPSLHHVMKF